MKFILLALLAACFPLSSPAFEAIEDLALDKCDLQRVVATLHAINIETQGRLSSASLENLAEIRRISSKAVKPDVAVGDQLSTADNVLFAQARERLITNGMRGLIESRRDRDAEVIHQLVQVADKNYRYQAEVSKGHSDYMLQEVLGALRGAQELSPRSVPIRLPSTGQCSIDLALYGVEVEGVNRINQMDMRPLETMLHDFQLRYKMQTIDRARLSPQDKSAYDQLLQTLVHPYQRTLRFVDDVENIRILAKASKLIYDSDKSDLEFSGGDGAKVGTTVSAIVAKEKADLLLILAVSLLRGKIDNERPSEAALNLQAQARVVEEANKKYPVKAREPK